MFCSFSKPCIGIGIVLNVTTKTTVFWLTSSLIVTFDYRVGCASLAYSLSYIEVVACKNGPKWSEVKKNAKNYQNNLPT